MVSYLIAIVIVFVSPLAVPVATTVFYAVRDWRRRAVDARAERSPAVGAVRADAGTTADRRTRHWMSNDSTPLAESEEGFHAPIVRHA